jgi:hypothetical protein
VRKINLPPKAIGEGRDMSLGRAIGTMAIVGLLFITCLSSMVSLPEDSHKGHSQELPGQSLGYTLRDPIRIYGNSDFTAANGVVSGSGSSSDPYFIEGWEIATLEFENGIVIQDTTAHFVIRDVYVHANSIEFTVGIDLDNTFNATVVDSEIFGYGYSLSLGPGANISIVNNSLGGAWWWAVNVLKLDNLTFLDNVYVSGRYGAMSTYSSTNLTLANNEFSGGREGGVSFRDSRFVNFSWNIIQGSLKYGIELNNSTNSDLNHNSFVNEWADPLQAYDDMGPENFWDDGYPSGGNYWSDYNGTDVMSGPNQDVPGSDGIGDTPYIIDADSQDNYPLMSTPSPPPVQPPMWPEARLSGQNAENVTISWGLSSDDGGNFKTVVGYEIHRNTTYEQYGLGYQSIGSVPNSTSEFTDFSTGEGDPNIYFYLVCAVDVNSNTSCAGQVIKYTRPLAKGMNLVSIPLYPSNSSTDSVFQTVHFDDLWTQEWSWVTMSFEWKMHSKKKPYKDELHFGGRKGVWINVTEDSNLTVAGDFVWPGISLRAGWSLVAFPSFNATYTVGYLKSTTNVTRVEGLDPTAPPYYLRVLGDGEAFQTGCGYWIYTDSYVSWVIPMF